MLISNIIKSMDFMKDYEIVNEQEFNILMLNESKCDDSACIFIDDEKYISSIPSNVTMIITDNVLRDRLLADKIGVLVTANPRLCFFQLHNLLTKVNGYSRKTFPSQIADSASISGRAEISKSNVIIGENVIIEPFVTIYPNVKIGDNTIIRAGATIGGCGFQFKRMGERIMGVEHVGGVLIGDNVEIQNNTCVDRSVFPWDNTVIGDNVKIDNLVQIAHGVKIDKNVLIAATSGIAGRVEIHEDAWIGVGATIRNGVEIGKSARANMGAVVTKKIEDNQAVTGNFAIDHQRFIENMKNLQNGC